MNMASHLRLMCSFLSLIFALTGCSRVHQNSSIMHAAYTPQPITIDGRLDEPIWQNAIKYPLTVSKDHSMDGKALEEPGQVMLAWDNDNFYVAAEFTDSDIVAKGSADQQPHYAMGDVCELFIKPRNKTWYWEMYSTPKSSKTVYFYPGQSYLGLPDLTDPSFDLKVASNLNGTLNTWQDRDNKWTTELAVSRTSLTARGEQFGPGSNWSLLVSRYNYSRYLDHLTPELSMTPQLTQTNFHLLAGYASMEFDK